jgi:hypothetical protein
MDAIRNMTNATKALVIAFVNAGLALVSAFGVSLSDAQSAAVITFVNAGLALWIALTYKDSSKRIPDLQLPDAK